MKFKSLALLAVLSMSSVYGAGGESGGGGGGICISDSKCLTLAQAGLRIDRRHSIEIEERVVDQIELIAEKLESFKLRFLINDVLGDLDTFKDASEEDSGKFEQFKNEYVNVIKNSRIDPKNFKLLAVSSGSSTFLLPGYYNLDDQGKALILIHEKLMRRFGSSKLVDILNLDGVLLDFVKDNGLADEVDVSLSLNDLGLSDKSQTVSLLIAKLIERSGGKMMADNLGEKNRKIDPLKAAKLKKMDSRAYRILANESYKATIIRLNSKGLTLQGKELILKTCKGLEKDSRVLVNPKGYGFHVIECGF